MSLIHVDDRSRVLTAVQGGSKSATNCRISGDYGVWHDVELRVSPHPSDNTIVVRLGDVRETPEFTEAPQIDMQPDPAALQKLHDAEARVAELERRFENQREQERAAQHELAHERWLGTHKDAGGEGLLILGANAVVVELTFANPEAVRRDLGRSPGSRSSHGIDDEGRLG